MLRRTMLSAALLGTALLFATSTAPAQVGYPIQVPVQQPFPVQPSVPVVPVQPGFVPGGPYRHNHRCETYQVVYRPGPRAPWQTYGVFPTMRQAKSVAWALRDQGFQARIWD